jgi:hypothetical protein
VPDADYYSLDVTAGQLINLEPFTPAGGAYQFSNILDAKVTLYDPSGAEVAFDDNSAADGRNAKITGYEALATGTYTIVVDAVGATHGEYFLETSVEDAPVGTQITGRHLFYENSYYDDPDATLTSNGPLTGAGHDPKDDDAIDPDVIPLMPGDPSAFENYSNYDKGINGVMVDIMGGVDIDLSDFSFATSRDGGVFDPLATLPSISVRAGAGVGGADRVTFIWDTATAAAPVITSKWLRVTTSTSVGLAEEDVFYFGNQIGDGDGVEGAPPAPSTLVNVADIGGARANPHAGGFLDTAPVNDLWDFNKDGRVNTADQGIARAKTQPTSFLRLAHFMAPMAGPLSAGPLSAELSGGDGGGLLVAALTGGDSLAAQFVQDSTGGWSDLGSIAGPEFGRIRVGGAANSSFSSGSTSSLDERIWADDEDEDSSGAGASSVDAALEDDADWLASNLDGSGWDSL